MVCTAVFVIIIMDAVAVERASHGFVVVCCCFQKACEQQKKGKTRSDEKNNAINQSDREFLPRFDMMIQFLLDSH